MMTPSMYLLMLEPLVFDEGAHGKREEERAHSGHAAVKKHMADSF
jgi:hypothetical protein